MRQIKSKKTAACVADRSEPAHIGSSFHIPGNAGETDAVLKHSRAEEGTHASEDLDVIDNDWIERIVLRLQAVIRCRF